MEPALLHDERTDLVSTTKLANQQASPGPAYKMALILAMIDCQPRSCSRFVEIKAMPLTE